MPQFPTRRSRPTSNPWDWTTLFLNVSGALMDGWMSVVEAAGNLQAPGIRGGFLGAYTSFPALGGHVGELVYKVGITTAVFYVVVTLVVAASNTAPDDEGASAVGGVEGRV